MPLGEGVERIPYFFTHGPRAVVCAECARDVLDRHPVEAEMMQARYFTQRLLACGHCGRFIGPQDEEEAMPV